MKEREEPGRVKQGGVASIQHNRHVNSVFISDVHLGFSGCSAEYLLNFLQQVRCSPLLAMIGANLYDLLLKMNTWINTVRSHMGKEYWSLAAYLKHKVKNAVQFIGRFEEAVVTAARNENVDGVVCGHIHRAEISHMQGVTYMNCGDWVESCTALMEHLDGRIELLQWREQATCLKTRQFSPDPGVTQGKAA